MQKGIKNQIYLRCVFEQYWIKLTKYRRANSSRMSEITGASPGNRNASRNDLKASSIRTSFSSNDLYKTSK